MVPVSIADNMLFPVETAMFWPFNVIPVEYEAYETHDPVITTAGVGTYQSWAEAKAFVTPLGSLTQAQTQYLR